MPTSWALNVISKAVFASFKDIGGDKSVFLRWNLQALHAIVSTVPRSLGAVLFVSRGGWRRFAKRCYLCGLRAVGVRWKI